MNQKSSSEVSSVVWPWRTPAAISGVTRPSRRWRAVIQSVVIGAVATLMVMVFNHVRFGLFLYILSAVVLVSGLFIPPVFKMFERFGQTLGHWVGVGLTWFLLTVFFCLCMIPGRLILLVTGKDPMRRRREVPRESYWIARKPADNASYTRQY
ncbi:MAG: hypothetical protein Q7J98_07555 [Kiritimatiellia bacterium]|nr:hypothetical protein [Kiritimatiellia bacterium]